MKAKGTLNNLATEANQDPMIGEQNSVCIAKSSASAALRQAPEKLFVYIETSQVEDCEHRKNPPSCVSIYNNNTKCISVVNVGYRSNPPGCVGSLSSWGHHIRNEKGAAFALSGCFSCVIRI